MFHLLTDARTIEPFDDLAFYWIVPPTVGFLYEGHESSLALVEDHIINLSDRCVGHINTTIKRSLSRKSQAGPQPRLRQQATFIELPPTVAPIEA